MPRNAPEKPEPTSDAALAALPADYASPPDMPVNVAQKEYAALGRLAAACKKPLLKVGITAEQIETLTALARRLLALEKSWQKARTDQKLTVAERKLVSEAELLDNKLVAGGRWACRRDPDAQTELSRITEGSSVADTIQDLRDLVEFWEEHAAALRNTDITNIDLQRAPKLADLLEEVSKKESLNLTAASARELRNRCFWAADDLAKEIREAGRYAFRQEPAVAAKYTSRYRTAAVRRTRQKKASTKPPANPASPPVTS